MYMMCFFRELDECIGLEDQKIQAIHEDFAVEEEQIQKEKMAIESRLLLLEEQEVSTLDSHTLHGISYNLQYRRIFLSE